jgi:hypothetical protein
MVKSRLTRLGGGLRSFVTTRPAREQVVACGRL